MYYREPEDIFRQVCAHQANAVNHAMLAEQRPATENEVIDCYTFITEGVNEFTAADLVGLAEQWFAGIFRSRNASLARLLHKFLAFDVQHGLLFEQDGVYRHNPAFDVIRMARA